MSKKLTTAEFIERARAVHGDYYDYSKTRYIDPKTKITVICPVHGPFKQRPAHHLDGHHCYKCGRVNSSKSNTISQKEFIKRAREIHGKKYDYSKTEYVTINDRVTIICPVHGEFHQRASGHLRGKGCWKCAGNIPLSTEEFVSRSRKVHGNKYDYSKVRYVNNSTKVVIGCPVHGDFKQSPARHMSGCDYPKCGKITIGIKKADTKETFLKKARAIHGRKYNYSKVEYTRSNRKVTIICSEHGEFQKTPNKHLLGEGCPKCSARYRRTPDEFIKDAQKIHKNKYDYSKANYINAKKKIVIICPDHGKFIQSPESHLAGAGCPRCSGKEITTKEFIRRARKVHNNIYDYSKVKYVNSTTKVTIICRKHGEFQQYQYNHLKGTGCPKCSGNRRLTTKEFIDQSRAVHGDKYDYSKVKYIRSADKVDIICPVHGLFKQKPNAHLAGVGCPICGNELISKSKRLSLEEFIKRAKAAHGNKYDYSKANYIDATTKVTIICPEHGEFKQAAGTHFLGSGCPQCAVSGVDLSAPGILYYLRIDTRTHRLWKIGITNRSVGERFIGRDLKNISVIKVWQYRHLRDAYTEEQEILQAHMQWLYTGYDEPLSKGGNTELFTRDVLGLDPEFSSKTSRRTRRAS